MFISELFRVEDQALKVNWHLSVDEVYTFLAKHQSEYFKDGNTISFEIKGSDYNTSCKIYFGKHGRNIKSLSFKIYSARIDYISIFHLVYERINKLMGCPELEENMDNLELLNNDLRFYPRVTWKNNFLSLNLFLFERFVLYWVVDIKRNIRGQ